MIGLIFIFLIGIFLTPLGIYKIVKSIIRKDFIALADKLDNITYGVAGFLAGSIILIVMI